MASLSLSLYRVSSPTSLSKRRACRRRSHQIARRGDPRRRVGRLRRHVDAGARGWWRSCKGLVIPRDLLTIRGQELFSCCHDSGEMAIYAGECSPLVSPSLTPTLILPSLSSWCRSCRGSDQCCSSINMREGKGNSFVLRSIKPI